MNRQLLVFAALLAAASLPRATIAALLSVDVNDRQSTDAPDSVTGFSTYVLTGTSAAVTTPVTQMVGAYSVTLAPVDDLMDENLTTAGVQDTLGAIDDRDRTTPTNSGLLTYAQIYDDFVFAGTSTGFTGGMDLTVSGGALMPNSPYLVSIYAFDTGSTAAPVPRTALWTDANNANAPVLITSFNGAVSPTTDNQYRFTGVARTDANGALRLQGRNTIAIPTAGGVTPGVFLNAFEINEIPEPASLGLIGMAGIIAAIGARHRVTRFMDSTALKAPTSKRNGFR
jgi:hypothetical protein